MDGNSGDAAMDQYHRYKVSCSMLIIEIERKNTHLLF